MSLGLLVTEFVPYISSEWNRIKLGSAAIKKDYEKNVSDFIIYDGCL